LVEGLGAECLQKAGAGSGRTGALQLNDVSFFSLSSPEASKTTKETGR